MDSSEFMPQDSLGDLGSLDALAQSLGSDTSATPAPAPESKPASPVTSPSVFTSASASRFDFRQTGALSHRQTRLLQQRHGDFIRGLSDRLSLYLRMDFSAQSVEIRTARYQKLISEMPAPTHLAVFKLEPLRGAAMLNLPPRLGLAICDRLLGGAAQAVNSNRGPTEIEMALLDQVVQIILDEWRALWRDWQELQPVMLGHETDARFLQISLPDTRMLVIQFEVAFGDATAPIQLVFPFQTFEPLLRWMTPPGDTPASASAASAPPPAPAWNAAFEDVRLPVSAGWPELELTARELFQLKPGDVVQLSPQCAGAVEVRVAGQPRFSGRLGTQGGFWAVELAQPLKAK